MKPNRSMSVACVVLLVLLAGCQKKPEPKVEAPSGPSVALPPNQMPPSDASMAPGTASGASSGNAATPTQASPSALTKEQEQTSMPQTGQANTHSTPDTTGEKK